MNRALDMYREEKSVSLCVNGNSWLKQKQFNNVLYVQETFWCPKLQSVSAECQMSVPTLKVSHDLCESAGVQNQESAIVAQKECKNVLSVITLPS